MIAAFVVKKEQIVYRSGSILVLINGLYYEVFCTDRTKEKIKGVGSGSVIDITIHEKIFETGHYLYGFVDVEEYSVFQLILTVTGIGQTSAIKILNQIVPIDLLKLINNNDVKGLSVIRGIGTKRAERIVDKLHGKN